MGNSDMLEVLVSILVSQPSRCVVLQEVIFLGDCVTPKDKMAVDAQREMKVSFQLSKPKYDNHDRRTFISFLSRFLWKTRTHFIKYILSTGEEEAAELKENAARDEALKENSNEASDDLMVSAFENLYKCVKSILPVTSCTPFNPRKAKQKGR